MLLLSLGTPMLLAGDEFRNTQEGNNNAYCQDNAITWLNWDWMRKNSDSPERRRIEAVSELIAIRKSLELFHHEDFFTRLTQLGLLKPSSRVQWFLPDGTTPMEGDWFDTSIRSFTMRLTSNEEVDVLIVINGIDKAMDFRLPADSMWKCLWSSAVTSGDEPKRKTVRARKTAGAAAATVPTAPEDNVWRVPALSISLIQQIDW